MSEDFDTDPGNGSEIAMPTSLEQAEAEAKSDQRLTATIERAAQEIFSRDRLDQDAIARKRLECQPVD